MRTRPLILALASCSVLAAAAAPPARACGSGDLAGAVATVIGLGMVGGGAMVQDIAFTVDDIRMAAGHVHPTRNDGAVELALNLPLTIGWTAVAATLGTATTYSYQPTGTSTRVEPVIFVPALIGALWSAGLAAHGLWAIATAPFEEPTAARRRRTSSSLQLAVVPTLLRDGSGYVGGLGCAGTF